MPTEELVLRPALESDVPDLLRVYLTARAAAPMPPTTHTEDQVGAWMLGWFGEAREPWLAEQDHEVVGLLVLEGDWLHSLYVAPSAQRRGVGAALLELAQARRPDGFALWVFASNEPARAFYRAQGLVELETTDGSGNEEGAPDVRMAWTAADPVAWLRGEIDEVDADLARLLARRAALTAAIQPHKPVPGHAGRDPRRERAIAARMAEVAPGLTPAAYARIVDRVVEVSLDAWENPL